jgi:hypothetical protein
MDRRADSSSIRRLLNRAPRYADLHFEGMSDWRLASITFCL